MHVYRYNHAYRLPRSWSWCSSVRWSIMSPCPGIESTGIPTKSWNTQCSRVLHTVAFLVWDGRSVLLEGCADAVFEGCIDEPTDGHHHEQGHDALGLFAREGGGQKLRVFAEAKPAFRPAGPLSLSSTAWADHCPSSSSFVARRKQLCGSTRARRSVSRDASWPLREGRRLGRAGPQGLGAPAAHRGAWGRRGCQGAMRSARLPRKRGRACWASASQAPAVRHRALKAWPARPPPACATVYRQGAELCAGRPRPRPEEDPAVALPPPEIEVTPAEPYPLARCHGPGCAGWKTPLRSGQGRGDPGATTREAGRAARADSRR